MYLAGPLPLRVAFRAFIAVVGTLMLAGAVNTSIVGSNGVLNRVSEDGILSPWFRHPHRRFGTSHHILNLVVGLQILTIVLSRGNIFLLGEAYAFGVMWSFALKGLAVLVLRYFDDMSEGETAQILGCSLGTVKSHAARALARLRAATVPHVDGPAGQRQPAAGRQAEAQVMEP